MTYLPRFHLFPHSYFRTTERIYLTNDDGERLRASPAHGKPGTQMQAALRTALRTLVFADAVHAYT
jgi:hypothetical protein